MKKNDDKDNDSKLKWPVKLHLEAMQLSVRVMSEMISDEELLEHVAEIDNAIKAAQEYVKERNDNALKPNL